MTHDCDQMIFSFPTQSLTEMNEENCKLRQNLMSLEKELCMCKGSIKSLELSQIDYEKLQKTHEILVQDIMSMKGQLMESTGVLKDLSRQKDRYKREYESMKDQLMQERKELSDFKTMSERNLSRLRKCIEEERRSYEERVRKLEEQALIISKERDEYVNKYRSSSGILDQIRVRMTAVEKTITSSPSSPEKKKKQQPVLLQPHHHRETTAPASTPNHLPHCHHYHHNDRLDGEQEQKQQQPDKDKGHTLVISPECHQKLKRQYKELKRKQSELTRLLNSMQVTAHAS